MGKLTVLKVRNAGAGRHGDGEGLYLIVKPTLARSWVLRIQHGGKRQDIGLGSVDLDNRDRGDKRPSDDLPILLKRNLTLAEARVKAYELRQFAKAGKNPIVERDRERVAIPTFSAATKDTHEALKAGWIEKNAAAFLTSLETYAFPLLGDLRVNEIEASHIRDMLAPIWTAKPELARKVRMRVGQVLNFSHSKGWRALQAPGKAVSIGLPKQPVGRNFAAMPYKELPKFASSLGNQAPTTGRLALLFQILTAARPGEVRLARWGQIDLADRIWARPAEIMKLRKEHSVTLSAEAVSLLMRVKGNREPKPEEFVFAARGGGALSDMTPSKVLRDAGIKYDAHGFRSAFRDWAAERMPDVPDPVAEAALAHTVPDRVVRAYKRTDFIEMRRRLLNSWGQFLSQRPDDHSSGLARE